jgi:hypothetical protein
MDGRERVDRWRLCAEDLIDFDPPTRDGRLGIGDLAFPEDRCVLRSISTIDSDQLGDGVNVPHDFRASFEPPTSSAFPSTR